MSMNEGCVCRYAAVMAPAAVEMQRLLGRADEPNLAPHEAAFYAAHAGTLREVVAKLQGLASSSEAHIDQAAKPLAALQGALAQLTRCARAPAAGDQSCGSCSKPACW